ncbi:hypothetical protein QM012_002602 [Aureobasidium pullulans]|uniref:Uncharacterized protein n=1 Tax=Aureobasidium pullulans TaxID=5580 RepID=A0ABR0TB83_AURPU
MGAVTSTLSGVPAARASRRPPPPPLPPSSTPLEYTLRALEWQQICQNHGPSSPEFKTFAHRAYTLAALERLHLETLSKVAD